MKIFCPLGKMQEEALALTLSHPPQSRQKLHSERSFSDNGTPYFPVRCKYLFNVNKLEFNILETTLFNLSIKKSCQEL